MSDTRTVEIIRNTVLEDGERVELKRDKRSGRVKPVTREVSARFAARLIRSAKARAVETATEAPDENASGPSGGGEGDPGAEG